MDAANMRMRSPHSRRYDDTPPILAALSRRNRTALGPRASRAPITPTLSPDAPLVQVLRVLCLGEEEPAFGQQAKGLESRSDHQRAGRAPGAAVGQQQRRQPDEAISDRSWCVCL
jgi:hypothetical protein